MDAPSVSVSLPLPTCPHCASDKRQIKVGRTAFGSRRFRCVSCNKDYAPQPKQKGYPASVRNEAMRLYVEGLSFRRIARVLGVNHQSVANWVTTHQAAVQAEGKLLCPKARFLLAKPWSWTSYTLLSVADGVKKTLGLYRNGG